MNDQSQMQIQMLNQPPLPQVQSQMMLQNPAQPSIMNQSHYPPMITQMRSQMPMNQPPMMMNRRYMPWQQHDPNINYMNQSSYIASKPRTNWKGKKGAITDKRKEQQRRNDKQQFPITACKTGVFGGGCMPPTFNELQFQNHLKSRKFYPKKKFNNRFAPYAPRNTTSFIIRAKKAGGIADLVSPCPVTPAVLPTPIFSPSREVLGDMAKEEWGVDGYGSMKGLIRLRSSPGNEDDDEEDGGGSSESDVEEHVEVERRLDHDLSRFEMICPNYGGVEYHNVLENKVDDQDSHITRLEEENLTLKERLFLMEREMRDLTRRMQVLERRGRVMEDVNELVVENLSDNYNESEGGGSDTNDAFAYSHGSEGESQSVLPDTKELQLKENVRDVCMEESVPDIKHQVLETLPMKKDAANEILSDDVTVKDEKHDNVGDDIVAEKDGVRDVEQAYRR